MESNKFNLPWLFLMALRDSRKNKSRLFLFTSSIILGIAALVAINSFGDNLKEEINQEAKTLLGADLVISSNKPVSEKAQAIIDSIGTNRSEERSFASMVTFNKTGETRLVQVRALKGLFPYYGEIETTPKEAAQTFRKDKKAVVDNTLLLQFNSEVGDSIKVGTQTFAIEGRLKKIPGQAGIAASVAPAVYIPLDYLASTGLEKKGSRIVYRYYYHFPKRKNIDAALAEIEKKLEGEGLRYETVKEKKSDTTEAFGNLTSFMNLVAFVALLLGCVGVASSVHIYVKEKIPAVAILRCLGLSGKQAFFIYLIQVASMGLIGSILGVILGSLLQTAIPVVLKDFLPLEVTSSISVPAILGGIIIGVSMAILFALIPLLSIRKVSPLLTLRSSFEEKRKKSDPVKYVVYLVILGFILLFAYNQIEGFKEALIFTGGLIAGMLILTGVSFLIMFLVKKFFPGNWSFIWRQGLANLYRPNNQTLILITSIGLGTALITTLYFVQNMLVNQVSINNSGNQPNMILFDIQTPQKELVTEMTKDFGLPVIQRVPIVTMRLEEINGKDKFESEKDTIKNIEDWVFNREYRVTFRDTLSSSEKIVEGEWHGEVGNDGIVYISLDQRFADNMKVKVGDELTFNVQGTPIKTIIGSFRKIDWNRIQTNFVVLFPKGILEQAPQFHVIATRADSQNKSAKFQQALVKAFPNVSIVDITLIINAVKQIVDRVSFVIRFMALFSIITGLLVLVGSVLISKYQRVNESILLRTLGASKSQILWITAIEYFLLGSLASLTGILLAIAAGWSFAYFNLDSSFTSEVSPVLLIYLFITTLTVIIGLLNSRGIINKPPLEILRAEA
ncbi:MAG TPA: FtsX-like permease family protein [Cytophagales bacterium]|nr:FtsX-like permease family protein [Cytophagales bacterium]